MFTLLFDIERRDEFAAFYQVYYEGSYNFLNIKEGDIILDAGAHVGTFTVLSCKAVGEKGLVVAVKPFPKNFDKLKRNVELNQCKNVVLLNKALWDKDGEMLGLEGEGVAVKVSKSSNIVWSISLETLLKEYHINKIKMDIEGSERIVIPSTNLDSINKIAMEVHGEKIYDLIYNSLTSQGFNIIRGKTEYIGRAISYALFHPLLTLKLEKLNHFETTKRVLANLKSRPHNTGEGAFLVYAYKKS